MTGVQTCALPIWYASAVRRMGLGLMNAINLGQYNGTYGRLSTIIEDAVVVDDYTVEMHLTQPYYLSLIHI